MPPLLVLVHAMSCGNGVLVNASQDKAVGLPLQSMLPFPPNSWESLAPVPAPCVGAGASATKFSVRNSVYVITPAFHHTCTKGTGCERFAIQRHQQYKGTSKMSKIKAIERGARRRQPSFGRRSSTPGVQHVHTKCHARASGTGRGPEGPSSRPKASALR